LQVKDVADSGRFLRSLHARCWLFGYGWMQVGRGGQLLERSIVDCMVGSPDYDTAGMGRTPEPPRPTTWTIYKIAAKAVRLGTVEAADEASAIEKAAAEFKVPATRLMAVRR
jgi:membrane-bound lytic murein transglycosylase B